MSKEAPVTTPAPPRLHRTLRFRDLVVYGLLFIAPMAPVGVFGVLDARSHGAVALVYLVATAAMAFTALSYAQMLRVVPQAGSVFAYARAGLGEAPGFVAGWLAMLDYLLIPAVAYLFSGIAMNALVPSVDRWVWTAAAVVVTTTLNLMGVRVAAVAGLVVLVMEIVVLVVFVVAAAVVLAVDGPQRGWWSPLTGDHTFAFGALLGAVSVAVLSFLGFDAIASFAEETERDGDHPGTERTGDRDAGTRDAGPRDAGTRDAGPRDPWAGDEAAGQDDRRAVGNRVGRAVLFCLALAGVLFFVQTALAGLLEPDSSAHLADHPEAQGPAFYDTVDASVGRWLHTLVAASKAIGAAFAALAGQAAAGRLLFAMGRGRRLPGVLSRVDRESGVPRLALLTSAVITLLAAVAAARRADGLDRLVSVVNVGALSAFTLLHLSVLGWYAVRHRESFAPLPHLVVPVLGAAITVTVIVEASRTAQWVALGWLVVGLLVLLVQGLTGHGPARRRQRSLPS